MKPDNPDQIFKIGISHSFSTDRLHSYNGNNLANIDVEFLCICTDVELLENTLKSVLKSWRFTKFKPCGKEWIKMNRKELIQIILNHLKLDYFTFNKFGVPIYHFNDKIDKFSKVDELVSRKETEEREIACPTYRTENSLLNLTLQDQMYIALYQCKKLWIDDNPETIFEIAIEKILVRSNLEIQSSLLEKYGIKYSNYIMHTANDFGFLNQLSLNWSTVNDVMDSNDSNNSNNNTNPNHQNCLDEIQLFCKWQNFIDHQIQETKIKWEIKIKGVFKLIF